MVTRLFSRRFSLRALIAVVSLVAIAFGVITQRARRQREAVEQLQRLGVGVLYDYQLRTPVNGQLYPSWLSRLVGTDYCHNVVNVFVHDPSDASAALPIVKQLPRLRTVYYCWNNGADSSKNTFGRYKKELNPVEVKSIVAIVG
jgi:hypothetical protein